MRSLKYNSSKITSYAAWLILLLGIALRLVLFFQNRSLFIDEGALASEIVSKSFFQLFQPLHYQFSPPLYSVLVKITTLVFGATEYALRFPTLVAGILALLILYRMLKEQNMGSGLILPLGLLAFGFPFVRYSTECKQYGFDVLVVVFLLYLFFRFYQKEKSRRFYLIAGITGAVMIWLSMPIVFVLFGLGGYLLIIAFTEKDKQYLIHCFGMISLWLASFAIYYFSILQNDVGIESLADYHKNYSFQFFPSNLEELIRSLNLIVNLQNTAIGATVVAQLLGLLFLIFGITSYWKKDRLLLVALLSPILACIIASGFGTYSLITRMILFLIPIILLIIGHGFSTVLEKINTTAKFILWILVLLIFINRNSFKYFIQPFQLEELRPVMEQVHEVQKENESVFVHHLGLTAFRFYQYHHRDKTEYELMNVTEGEWFHDLDEVIKNQELPCWVILTHVNDIEREKVFSRFRHRAHERQNIQAKNSGAWLFEEK